MRNWPIGDGGYASGIHRNPFGGNDKSQKTDFLNMELVFFELDKQAVGEEFFENKTDMFDVLLESV